MGTPVGAPVGTPSGFLPFVPGMAGGFPGNAQGFGDGGPGVAGWGANNQIADYAGQFRQRAIQYFDAGAGFATAAAGRQAAQRASALPQFTRRNVRQVPAAPSPYQKAASAVQRGFGDVGGNYGSVVKQGKKAKKAVPSSAQQRINKILGK